MEDKARNKLQFGIKISEYKARLIEGPKRFQYKKL